MTKDELIAIAVERKLVRTKTEARGMKVDALRALVEADAASTGYEHVVEDVNAVLEADTERERAERDLREGRERDEALAAAYHEQPKLVEIPAVFDPETGNITTLPGSAEINHVEWGKLKPAPAPDMSVLDRLRALPERNRHERRRKATLLRQAMR